MHDLNGYMPLWDQTLQSSKTLWAKKQGLAAEQIILPDVLEEQKSLWDHNAQKKNTSSITPSLCLPSCLWRIPSELEEEKVTIRAGRCADLQKIL